MVMYLKLVDKSINVDICIKEEAKSVDMAMLL